MVCLRKSKACMDGNHDKCEVSRHPPKRDGQIVFGGWMCTCHCHKPKVDMDKPTRGSVVSR